MAFARLRGWAKALKRDVLALWFACRDPATPLLPKLLASAIVVYALSPIDLIPDFIPILGFVDDMILLPAAMKLLGEGSSVLFLSGASTHLVLPGYGALASAKALGDCFVRYLAIECAQQGINFNTLGSGPVDTELYRSAAPKSPTGEAMPPPVSPNGKRITAEDLAEVAAFLVSKGGSMIRGQVVLVDGGMSTTVRVR